MGNYKRIGKERIGRKEVIPNEDFCRPYLVLLGIDAERYKSGELSVSELGEKKLTELYYKNHTPIKRVPAKQRKGLFFKLKKDIA